MVSLSALSAISVGAQAPAWRADPEIVARLSKARPDILYDEARVPAYTLPDPLKTTAGTTVTTAAEWPARRAEILALFRDHVYGRSPGKPDTLKFREIEARADAMDGAATLRRVAIDSTVGSRTHTFELTLFLPNAVKKPAPVFLLINNRPAANTDPTRNEKSGFWPAEQPAVMPVPSHLAGWVEPLSFEDDFLTAAVRCPCGGDRFEFHYPGETQSHDGEPCPCTVKIGATWFFLVKAVCADCRGEHVLFDRHFHGCDGFLHHDPEAAALPRPPLVPWACLKCGSVVHAGELCLVLDYEDRFVEYGYAEKFGPERWPDAFGSFAMSIRCADCGHDTPGWVSYETR